MAPITAEVVATDVPVMVAVIENGIRITTIWDDALWIIAVAAKTNRVDFGNKGIMAEGFGSDWILCLKWI